MFYYLEGTVALIDTNVAVLDVGGVGFRCNATLNTLSYLEIGKRVRLYTYCYVKEDAFDIYGFYHLQEQHCFELLLSVSGVGPKAALSILSVVSPENLAMSIITENEKALTAAPGIGKRIAQRIILELKDKMAKESAGTAFGDSVAASYRTVPGNSKLADATAALLVLGYQQQEITVALSGVDIDSLGTEEIIKAVLKNSLK